MRRSALAGLLASVLSLTLLSPGVAAPEVDALVSTPPGSTTDTGSLTVDPASFTVGQKVTVGANFPSGSFTVTLFKETGSNVWDEVDTDESNANGNAYFYDYQVDGTQKLYARITDGPSGRTETKTLTPTPKIEPTGGAEGALSVQPTVFTKDQKVQVVANFSNGVSDVGLYRKTDGVWVKVGSDESSTAGNAYFKDYVVKGGEELFARKANGDDTEVDTLTAQTIDPANFPETGSLSLQGKVYDGRKGTVVANFPNGVFDVTVYKKDGGTWVPVGNDETSSAGNAYVSGVTLDGPQEFFGLASTGNRTAVQTLTPASPSDVSGGPKTLGKNRVYVTTDSGKTPVTKGVDYEGKAVMASGDVETATWDVEEIAVRGNSSATKAKKPYKLKFEDKQKPFGMKNDKTWILLANYGDWTLVRSMVAWDLGKMFDGLKWTPTSTFAELFLNGKYLGSYQMVESIKIDKNRVNVDAETGQVIEIDPHWKEDGVPGFVGESGLNYAWKDPDEFKELDNGDEDPEGLTNAKINDMKQKIRNFEDVLYARDWSKVADFDSLPAADDWKTYLDMDSAVDYYITREFTKDNDANFYRSNFFYTNDVDPNSDAKLFLGPIWDFDRSAGACTSCENTGVASPSGWWMRGGGKSTHNTNNIHWYTRLIKDPRFLNALHDRWAEMRGELESTFAGEPRGPAVSRAVTKLGGADDYDLGKQVAANDRAVWQNYGTRYHARSSTYSGELEWLRNWYKDRFNWMDGQLKKAAPPIP